MKTSIFPLDALDWSPLHEGNETVRVEVGNVKIDIRDRRGSADMVVAPVDKDYIFTMATTEFHFDPHQVRLSLKGVDDRDVPDNLLAHARTEIANILFAAQPGRPITKDELIARLQNLSDFIEGRK